MSILETYAKSDIHECDIVSATLNEAVAVIKQSILEESGYKANHFKGLNAMRGGTNPKVNDMVIYCPRESFFKRAVVTEIISDTNIRISLLVLRNKDGSGLLGSRVVHPSQLALLHRPNEHDDCMNKDKNGMPVASQKGKSAIKNNKIDAFQTDSELIYQIYLSSIGLQEMPIDQPSQQPSDHEVVDEDEIIYLPSDEVPMNITRDITEHEITEPTVRTPKIKLKLVIPQEEPEQIIDMKKLRTNVKRKK